jgi:hypothetical protein
MFPMHEYIGLDKEEILGDRKDLEVNMCCTLELELRYLI